MWGEARLLSIVLQMLAFLSSCFIIFCVGFFHSANRDTRRRTPAFDVPDMTQIRNGWATFTCLDNAFLRCKDKYTAVVVWSIERGHVSILDWIHTEGHTHHLTCIRACSRKFDLQNYLKHFQWFWVGHLHLALCCWDV